MSKKSTQRSRNAKEEDLNKNTVDSTGAFLTTDQGLKINDDHNSLKAGERGATLLEDFILREKITHFDHERIPERIVHARGSAAHGYFQVYESMARYTKAGFLNDPSLQTPVFVRFSTVAGSRGSTDLARDVRGFAVKFYTREGNYDLVGNNMPVFFIQDAMKFPDLIHAAKPEPDNEMPQAATAHDTFWDFISLSPESMHMVMWAMSDRALPRSYRMMEGFGVHTFRLINDKGKAHFVKFHWKPLLGVHAVAWDEAQKLSGKDPDFHRRDLYEAIAAGTFPEWELGVQLIPEADEHKFDFDLLDPTKLIPEELVPVQRIGKMVLNRNPDNFFAETEQVAFHPGHLVPGIDFSNDPLLQGRLFSYTDTQLSRLGSPNFHEIPINRSMNIVHNNQRDGHMRMQINTGKASYLPNSIAGGCPYQAKWAEGGFASYEERIDAVKVRGRSKSFLDFFSQASLFFNSQSDAEQMHIVNAFRFELGKVQTVAIRQRVVNLLGAISKDLARQVAEGLGLKVMQPEQPVNHQFGADANPKDYQNKPKQQAVERSAALSMAGTIKDTIQTRHIAFLIADGVNKASIQAMKNALEKQGATVKLVGTRSGFVLNDQQETVVVDMSLLTTSSVVFDAVFIPAGKKSVDLLKAEPDAVHFINEAYRHCKAIAADKEGAELIAASYVTNSQDGDPGIVTGTGKALINGFAGAIARHRFWERELNRKVPA